MDLALNNLQRLICHKTNKPNQTITKIRKKKMLKITYNICSNKNICKKNVCLKKYLKKKKKKKNFSTRYTKNTIKNEIPSIYFKN